MLDNKEKITLKELDFDEETDTDEDGESISENSGNSDNNE